MSDVTLAGNTVSSLRLQVPSWGCPWADATLSNAAELTGQVTLIVGGLSQLCTVVSGGSVNGTARYRLVGGYGGWGEEVPRRGYNDDAGVRLQTVIGDAASAVGEAFDTQTSSRLGPHFARVTGPANAVLNAVAPQAWYVDSAGVTQLGARPAVTYSGKAPITDRNPAGGVIELAPEDCSQLLPGVSVYSLPSASDVEISLEGATLRARVYYQSSLSRRLVAFAKIIDAIDPYRRYRGIYEYRVVSQSGDRFNLQIVRSATGMPDLTRVPVRPGMSGLRATVAPGEVVLLAFADCDPGRPQIIAHEAPDSPGWSPSLLELGNVGGQFAAMAGKVSDEIQRIRTWADAHTHPTGVGPSGPPAAPTTAHQSVACGKVKVA